MIYKGYTAERNIQIVLRLLKEHGIKRVVASPGATDVSIVASMQHDPWFEMYSCIDERSAAYIACGMAAEKQEPVVIVCTGATSSRNYMPGMTEAYYRHLPVLAITCSRNIVNVGHYMDQVTDRSCPPSDTVMESVYAQFIDSPDDEWDVMIKVNKALLALKFNGGGPSHINLATTCEKDFSCKELPKIRVIERYTYSDNLPTLPKGRNGVFVGAHVKWSKELTEAVDRFCEVNNAAVFCDHTSNYKGKYRVLFPLITDQFENKVASLDIDVLIHIGYISNCIFKGKQIWRVNKDGIIRDPFRKMTKVFQMSEFDFFNAYNTGEPVENTVVSEYQSQYDDLLARIPELPLSNMWCAQKMSKMLPDNSVIHFGIRNSLRSWNYFEVPESVLGYCNTGGFGIDGGVSSLIGASMMDKDKLYFGVFGDLLFFYDMNSIGNRDICSNLRIMIVNNGLGQEFKNYGCGCYVLGDEVDQYIAARGHYGNMQADVIKSYAESLGFEYLCATTKEEFMEAAARFTSTERTDRPMLLEVITRTEDESKAFEEMTLISKKSKVMRTVKTTLDAPALKGIKNTIKDIVKK